MKYVKFAMIASSLLAAVLGLSNSLLSLGGQGIFTFACSILPAVLGGMFSLKQATMPRWAAIVSTLSFLIVAMKTSGGGEGNPLQNIMMAAALGLVLALVLAIKPEKA